MVIGGKIANDFAKGSKNENIWTLAGVTLGAFMGNEVGAALDQQDLLMAQKTQYQALEYNKANVRSTWSNPTLVTQGKYIQRGHLFEVNSLVESLLRK